MSGGVASIESALIAASNKMVWESLLPSRRRLIDRVSTSFSPTTAITGVFERECSLTL